MLEATWTKNGRSSLKSKFSNQTKKKIAKDASDECKHWVWRDVGQPTTRLNQICRRIEELKEKNMKCIHTLSKYDHLQGSSPTFAQRSTNNSSSPGKLMAKQSQKHSKSSQTGLVEYEFEYYGDTRPAPPAKKLQKQGSNNSKIDGRILMRKKRQDWSKISKDGLILGKFGVDDRLSSWNAELKPSDYHSTLDDSKFNFQEVNTQLKKLLQKDKGVSPTFNDLAARARKIARTVSEGSSKHFESSNSQIAVDEAWSRPASAQHQNFRYKTQEGVLAPRMEFRPTRKKPSNTSKSFDLCHLKQDLKGMGRKELLELRGYIEKKLCKKSIEPTALQSPYAYINPEESLSRESNEPPLTFSRQTKGFNNLRVPNIVGLARVNGEQVSAREPEFSGLDFNLVKTDKIYCRTLGDEYGLDCYQTLEDRLTPSDLLSLTPATRTKITHKQTSHSNSGPKQTSIASSEISSETPALSATELLSNQTKAKSRHQAPNFNSKRRGETAPDYRPSPQRYVTKSSEPTPPASHLFQNLMHLDSSVCESVLALGSGEPSRVGTYNRGERQIQSFLKEDRESKSRQSRESRGGRNPVFAQGVHVDGGKTKVQRLGPRKPLGDTSLASVRTSQSELEIMRYVAEHCPQEYEC